jgi:hypothetical protein
MHAILADSRAGFAMSAGHTVIITPAGCEVLSQVPLTYDTCVGRGFREWARSI